MRAPAALVRRLGPFDAAAIIVSNVIGGGILFAPPQVAASIPSPALFLLIWIVGGALAFAGAMAYAELAAVRPRAGGEYVYLDAAFGRLAAFLTGWTSFVAGFSGAIAASAVVFASYLGRFVAGASDGTPLVTVPIPWVPLTVSRQTLVAGSGVPLVAGVSARGGADSMGAAHRVAPDARGGVGDRADGVDSRPRRRSRARRRQRAGGVEGVGDRDVHRARLLGRRRVGRQSRVVRRHRPRDVVAAGARAGDVHVRRMERGDLRGGRDPRSGPQHPARAGHGHARSDRDLLPAQSSLPLCRADRKPRRRKGQRAGCDRRQGARRPRRGRDGRGVDRQPRCEHQRDDHRRAARVLRDGARRRFLRAGGAGARTVSHACRIDRRAGHLERSAGGVGRRGRADPLHRIRGGPVFGCGGGGAVGARR